MSFDPSCGNLADLFLEDCPRLNTPRKRSELAQLIQTTIEDWIDYEDAHYEDVNYEPPPLKTAQKTKS